MNFLTADICDQHPKEVSVAESILRHFGGKRRFHGKTVTIKVHEDNVLVRKAVESPGDGRVLVVDGGGSMRRALLGDRLAGLAADNGWSGVIVNGCIRDSVEIAKTGIGVVALGTNPMKSNKNGDGDTGISVSFAGITIRPGQYVYADEDGWLVSDQPVHDQE
jgi:regulator of ribonuclease activity A